MIAHVKNHYQIYYQNLFQDPYPTKYEDMTSGQQ